MDLLLAHGYFLAEDAHERKVMKPYPPLGLLYLAAYLKSMGWSVEVFDSTFQSLADFEARLRAARPPVVGLYVNLMTKFNALRMMAISRQAGARVVLGGPEPAAYAAEYLAAGADVIVVGEGEQTLQDLLGRRFGNLESVPGIIFRGADGAPVATPARPMLADLDALPFPDRDAIDTRRYIETWRQHHGLGSLSLITARGCPFHCQWCSHAVYGHTHRRRSTTNVADELEMLLDRYRPDMVWYADDVFTIHRRWFLEYARSLQQRGLRVPFECISRPDRLDDEVVAALADMGCFRLWIGSESGSQRVLDLMQRGTRVEDVQAKTRLLQRAGIQVGMFIMLGYEGEGPADIQATADHLKRANPDVFLTTVAYPIKGTGYYQQVSDRIQAPGAWQAISDRDLRVSGRRSRRYYSFATRWMVNIVALEREWRTTRRPALLARSLANTLLGRAGMLATAGERD
jgi:anaerobic magnesium-protoporphyrin IX monomethyl ester cyclase